MPALALLTIAAYAAFVLGSLAVLPRFTPVALRARRR